MYFKLANDNDFTTKYIQELIDMKDIELENDLLSIVQVTNNENIEIFNGEVVPQLSPPALQLRENEKTTTSSGEWNDSVTKVLLDKYETYLSLVGPMRTKKMWEKIAKDIEHILQISFSPLQVENRSSGAVRQPVPYESELSKIALLDDSIEPEVKDLPILQ
ncbi:hypothetical protein QE152_g6959 [Popillia japonica]|uniref:Uncharacterized protein n=1 Tax=Popillia japonica TaxID=7064 RepID=A0AAW1MGI1_POPJA